MIDHYKTLDLPVTATSGDVKKAFRRLAKKFHPDRNSQRSQWATARMRGLIEANRVLSDSRLRTLYDLRHKLVYGRQKSDRFEKYRPERSPLAAQADRILDCLLHGKARQAIKDYERLVRSKEGFELSDHLDLRDWVDAKFLIAEEYERSKKYKNALEIYEALYYHEQAVKRHSNFRREVADRMLKICSRHLASTKEPKEAAEYFMRALSLDLPRAKRAHIHKKLAECHLAIDNDEAARQQLRIAFELKSDLKGATKICNRLGFDPAAMNGDSR